MNTKTVNQNSEGICPKCHQLMQHLAGREYYCQSCKQNYYEQYLCPICKQALEQITGCGATNYLCKSDGLVSSKNVQFHYLAQ